MDRQTRGVRGLAVLAAIAVAMCAWPRASRAQRAPANAPAPSASASTAADAVSERGIQAYRRGIALTKGEQWGEALSAFEEAASIRDAPRVEYNIAYCQRALGRYVAARRATQKALHDTSGLDPSEIENSK